MSWLRNHSRHRSFDAAYCTATIAEIPGGGLLCLPVCCSRIVLTDVLERRASFMSTGLTAFRKARTGPLERNSVAIQQYPVRVAARGGLSEWMLNLWI